MYEKFTIDTSEKYVAIIKEKEMTSENFNNMFEIFGARFKNTYVFKVYGRIVDEAHEEPQKLAYSSSDLSVTRKFACAICNADITGEYAFTELRIKCDADYDAVICELGAQISDGIFENCHTGRVVDVISGTEVELWK